MAGRHVLLVGAAVALLGLCYAVAGVLGPYSDLFPRWYGLRTLLLEGRDPYGASVAEEIARQTVLLGTAGTTPALTTAYGFLYPLPGALPLAPLALLPYRAAHALWLFLGAIALPCSALLAFDRWSEGRQPRRAALLCVPLAYVFLPSLWNLALAQPGLAVVPLVALALGLDHTRPAVAGSCLAAAMLLKPQLVLPLGPFWLAYQALRWWRDGDAPAKRFLLGSVGTGFTLGGVATLLVPSWLSGFLGATRQYAQVPEMAPLSPAVYVLLRTLLPGGVAAPAAAALVVGLLGWAAVGWRDGARRGVYRSIVAGALAVPPAWETSGIMLLIPLAGVLTRLTARAGVLWLASIALVSLVLAPLSLVLPWQNGALIAVVTCAQLATAEALRLWGSQAGPRDRSAAAAGAAAPPAPARPAPR